MASQSPKGYKKFGDISEVALKILNDTLTDGREPTIKREYFQAFQKSEKHIIFLFEKLPSDNLVSNKMGIYLDCLNSYNNLIYENTYIDNIRYVTNFKDEIFYMIEIKLT